MSSPKNIVLPYAESFGAEKERLPGGNLSWLTALRQDAAEQLARHGLPSRKVEAWKYTSLAPLAEKPLRLAQAGDAVASVSEADLPEIEGTYRVVFVNGRYRPDLSARDAAPEGVELRPLSQAFDSQADWLEDRLGASARPNGNAMINANTAFMTDGCVLCVKDGAAVETPLHLVFVGAGGAADGALAHHPRNLMVAGKGSKAMVIESHVAAAAEAVYWSNPVCEITVEEGASLDHYKIQDDSLGATHLSFARATIAAKGVYNSFVLTLGAGLSRNEIEVRLGGEEANCRLHGAYLVRGTQHADTSTFIDHAKPHCDSDEVYKGVLDGKAKGVFQGKILVAKDAQKTNGNQLSRAIFLSDDAEVNTKPELEIYADDVKCSHGATAGELDDDSMFYMKARGIPEDQARRLLIRAFIGEQLDDIENEPLRHHLEKLVENWLNKKF